MATSPSWGGTSSAALDDGPSCWRTRPWVFAGWAGGGRGRTTLGSLDPSFLPAVPSLCQRSCPALGLLPFVRILPPSHLGCLTGQEQSSASSWQAVLGFP